MVAFLIQLLLAIRSRFMRRARLEAERRDDHIADLVCALFAAILKVLPDVNLRWSDVWAGGVFIAVLFVIGNT
jgi:hypothetical protein